MCLLDTYVSHFRPSSMSASNGGKIGPTQALEAYLSILTPYTPKSLVKLWNLITTKVGVGGQSVISSAGGLF